MIKNILETKEGRRLGLIGLALLCSIIVLGLLFIKMPPTNKKATQTPTRKEKYAKQLEESAIKNATVYQGVWISNRADNMQVEIKSNGTYEATRWLTTGYVTTDGKDMTFKDKNKGKVNFSLETQNGRTFLRYKSKKENILLFPDEETKKIVLNLDTENKVATEQVKSQKWLDVLQKGSWESEKNGDHYEVTFDSDTYTQTYISKEKKEKKVYQYRILSQEESQDQKSCSIALVRTDTDGNQEKIECTLTEKTSVYQLNASAGTFLWLSSYQKDVSKVPLTQTGVDKEEAKKITQTTVDENGNQVVVKEESID